MAAHPIGNHRNAMLAIDGDGILVERTDPTGIGQTGKFKTMVEAIQAVRPESRREKGSGAKYSTS
jgi:hypothetical protein